MDARAVRRAIASSESTASALAGLFVYDSDRDGPGMSIPRPEIHLVARFGPSAPGGLDVHAFGGRQKVLRKLIRGGQRAVTARLRLGLPDAVLGVPAAAVVGHVVALEQLWGNSAAQRLYDQLAATSDTTTAAVILASTIAERMSRAEERHRGARLALAAADRLASANVDAVAADLGVSARHLRRTFHETVGMGPKAFTRITRFGRALDAARARTPVNWASIAATAGYYDQAHLIAEFRAIAGVTPSALLGELRALPLLM